MDGEKTASKDGAKNSEIDKEFRRMNESLEYLTSVIQKLEVRLNPVLSQVGPKEENEQKDKIGSETEIGGSISSFSDKIGEEAELIEDLIHRLGI